MSVHATTTVTVELGGTSSQPLGRYLKALGILRITSEQLDSSARGAWVGGVFQLTSIADIDALVDFFVNQYIPTPLISPWNNGSGFGKNDPKSSKAAFGAVKTIAESRDPRLSNYRETIASAHRLTARLDWFDLEKEQQVALCRNEFPDIALDWLDAAVVLTSEHRAFPPLLGTGGNDGRFEFSSTYMQLLMVLLGHEPRKRNQASILDLTRFALVEDTVIALDRMGSGQFDPAASGPAVVPFGSSRPVGNPWDFVLLLEGALLFASSVARRLSSTSPQASVPFAVTSTHAGHPTAARDESARGELWAPLWNRPATFLEVTQLLSEGRVDYNGRQAASGLDVARAASSLGVDRGIDGFVRHAFLQRNGLSTYAVPLGYHRVEEIKGVRVLSQLDSWTDRLSRVRNPPASLASGLQQIQNAQFAATSAKSEEGHQRVLMAAAHVDRLAARSSQLRELAGRARLMAGDWVPLLYEKSDEFAIALALASLRGDFGASRGWLANLMFDPRHPERPGRVPGLDGRPIARTLADCAIELAIKPPTKQTPTPSDEGGLPVSLQEGAVAGAANWRAAQALADGLLDETKLRDLFGALLLLDWSKWSDSSIDRSQAVPEFKVRVPLSASLAVLAPLFTRRPWQSPFKHHRAVAGSDWPRRLVAGQVEAVCAEAHRRYRIAGIDLLVSDPAMVGYRADGHRLAAACLVPIRDGSLIGLLKKIARAPHTEGTPALSTPENGDSK